jgi:molybdenum cofactor cytidylyltransferase
VIAGLLLAAGRSTRFGADKLAAPLGGRAVVRWSAESLARGTDGLFIVIPLDAPAIRQALANLDAVLVPHPGRDAGMGSSIRAGVAALPDDVEAVVIALGDQPLVSSAVVARLCERWRATGAMAVAPLYPDGRGHPVLFDRACFASLLALDGDVGAREVLQSLGAALELVAVDQPAPLDVDTPDALRAVVATLDRSR